MVYILIYSVIIIIHIINDKWLLYNFIYTTNIYYRVTIPIVCFEKLFHKSNQKFQI